MGLQSFRDALPAPYQSNRRGYKWIDALRDRISVWRLGDTCGTQGIVQAHGQFSVHFAGAPNTIQTHPERAINAN
jgi:hypothetical protein